MAALGAATLTVAVGLALAGVIGTVTVTVTESS